MQEFVVPEMIRIRLEDVVLKIKFLGLGDVSTFLGKVMDKPRPESVTRAVATLAKIGALTANDELTPLGYRLANLPMNPQIGKMVLMGMILRCLDPILTLAATMDMGKDPFHIKVVKYKLSFVSAVWFFISPNWRLQSF